MYVTFYCENKNCINIFGNIKGFFIGNKNELFVIVSYLTEVLIKYFGSVIKFNRTE